ncbi:DUF1269 domain-containing protein [Microlunatus ginsengisoli]|uniref:DUF1269 domain-containing protein n=1 Tax=Microlunatus ginsengisoli TaxID=363863 RepID=A0ABP7ALI4_9ACTN
MPKKDEEPLELYIATYSDSSVAEAEWNALKQSAHDKTVTVEALALVDRDEDGKVHVKDTTRETGVGAAIGAVGGAVVGLIFPPSLLASAAIGAGIGAGTGKIVDRVSKRKVQEEVEWAVGPGQSGIVVLFPTASTAEVEQGLTKADRVVREHIEDDDGKKNDEPDIYR